jgi:hypothetical protein
VKGDKMDREDEDEGMSQPVKSYWELIEPVFEQINIYAGPEAFSASVQSMSQPQILLYAAHMCQSEVRNGGLLQLFWNNTGVLVPEAIDAYKAINMPQASALIAAAAAKLGESYPRDRDERWDALLLASGLDEAELSGIFQANENLYIAFAQATRSLALDSIDRQFWELLKVENDGFEEAATRYARSCM